MPERGTLRLVGGPTPLSGVLEIWNEGAFGSICHDGFDFRDAVVACRQLGFATGRPLPNAVLGRSAGPVWMTNMGCVWDEARLDACPNSGYYEGWCWGDHARDVGLECSNGERAGGQGLRGGGWGAGWWSHRPQSGRVLERQGSQAAAPGRGVACLIGWLDGGEGG